MKKILFILLCLFQLHSAIVVEALPDDASAEESTKYWQTVHGLAKQAWDNIGKWEENFDIDGGRATIYHGENWISIVSNELDAIEEISQFQGQCKEIYLTHWRGKQLTFPLHLKWNSTSNDFVNELIRSGLYTASGDEKIAYRLSHNWTDIYTVIGMGTAVDCYGKEKTITSVEHTPFGIVFYDNECKINGGHTHLKLRAPNGRVLYAHLTQSPRAFKEVLIEAGYMCFQQYPVYSIQAEVIRDTNGKEKIYFRCCYWGVSKEEECPFTERLRLAQEQLEKEKIERAERIAARNSVPVLPSILKTTAQKQTQKSLRDVHFNSSFSNTFDGYEEEKTQEITEEVQFPGIVKSNILRTRPNMNFCGSPNISRTKRSINPF